MIFGFDRWSAASGEIATRRPSQTRGTRTIAGQLELPAGELSSFHLDPKFLLLLQSRFRQVNVLLNPAQDVIVDHTLVPQFNTWRMVEEYTRKYYLPK